MPDPLRHPPEAAEPGRRALAKGIAWSLPAVTLGATAPASAASLPPGLQGWIAWSRSCVNNGNGTATVTLGLDGNGPNNQVYPASQYGFYVYNTTPTTNLTGACVTWGYSPNYAGQITWTAQTGSGPNWSAPALIATNPYTWQTCYTGAWTYNPASGGNPSYSITNEVPIFRGTSTYAGSCPASRTISITRTVVVNGQTISFTRTVVV